MYLDGFLSAIGVDEAIVKQIRANLNGFADDIGGVRLAEAGGLGGSAAAARLAADTDLAQQHIVGAMQELAAALREFGINLDLWQGDMSYTDDDAGDRIRAIQVAQERVSATNFHDAPAAPLATAGDA